MDVKFSQSTDSGVSWTPELVVNDNIDPETPTDQFQPSVAAGPNGAVAIAFYDRRSVCPSDPSILPEDVGRANFCIDLSLQAFRDSGGGAVPVESNVPASRASIPQWRPARPLPPSVPPLGPG
jgi:hypothetical protein